MGRKNTKMQLVLYLIFIALLVLIGIIVFLHNKKRINIEIHDAMLNSEELVKHASELALKHVIGKNRSRTNWVIIRMNENYNYISSVYRRLIDDVNNKRYVVSAAEWLLDNFYIIEQQIKEIRKNYSERLYTGLPILKEGALKGYPRVYAIAMELISHTDGMLDENLLIDFINSYQKHDYLTSQELWAISVMIRIALIENIRQLCTKIENSQNQFMNAAELANYILTHIDEDEEILFQTIQTKIDGERRIDSSFAEFLLRKLRLQGSNAAHILRYIDEKLAELGTSAEKIIQLEHQQQAAGQISMGNAITSLRMVAGLDWSGIFEMLSQVEQILRQDPSGVYTKMNFESRDYYRREVERLSKKCKISEVQIARKAVECASNASIDNNSDERVKHVGYYLIGRGKQELIRNIRCKAKGYKQVKDVLKNHAFAFYSGTVVVLTLLISLMMGYYAYTHSAGRNKWFAGILAALISFIPASEITIGLINWIITRISRVMYIPKLELQGGIPDDAAAMVVIPTLISGEKTIDELMSHLEVFYLANREKNLYFAIIGDYKDEEQQEMPQDKKIIQAAERKIEYLNKKYKTDEGDIFFLFHRHRQFNKSQNKWMGWERKRGALVEFCDLLRDAENTSFSVIKGDITRLPHIKYIITLDADTILPRDTAKKLIGTMLHPLNKPIVDNDKQIVIEGYGLLQPKINVAINSANKSLFSRIFAGQGGVDPYTTAVSDIYQDLFGEGIFTGKGIFDIDIFRQLLKPAIPENTVLSHDLLEGCYIRTGLVTDLEFVDGYPWRYNSYIARQHRWVRGDWQLIPWLGSKVKNSKGELVPNPLSALSRWKIFDNLRRSLVTTFVTLLIVLALTVLPGNTGVWLFFALLTVSVPLVSGMIDAIICRHYRYCMQKRHATIIFGLKGIVYQVGIQLAFLPYHAYMMMDAIIRTLIRVLITHKNMLEWITAADTEKKLKNDILSFVRRMWFSPVAGFVLLILTIYAKPALWAVSMAVLMVWVMAPFLAHYISIEIQDQKYMLSDKDRMELRRLARKTWRYFEDFATEEENYLPPDNYQEDPPNGIAHRTSPTNIGMLLISTLAARDFGYIGTPELFERIDKTVTTIEKMDKWRGHLYNWYDTRTLRILRPLYVSTVDSGNFIGYLITLNQGLKDYINKPLIDAARVYGLEDTAVLAKEENESLEINMKIIHQIIEFGKPSLLSWSRAIGMVLDNDSGYENERQGFIWKKKLEYFVEQASKEIDEFIPWVRLLEQMPEALKKENGHYAKLSTQIRKIIAELEERISVSGLNKAYPEAIKELKRIISNVESTKKKNDDSNKVEQWITELCSALEAAFVNVVSALYHAKQLTDRIQRIIDNTHFAPLYDHERQLFSIGYNIEEDKLTNSYYDLLASEARQTSYIAIARGEISQKHWQRLGRSLTMVDGYKGLVSWTGTMFEYMMPLLIMKNYKNTLLDETYWFVVRSQKRYGALRKVPWGTSESGYSAFDMYLNYQYKAFGVPELGLKRGLIHDMVVAPYATVLALPVDPDSAVENIRILKEEGLEGDYGFYEAIDYTPERLTNNEKSSIVKSYMVHHQGMSIMALDNFMNDNVMQERFHSDPVIKSAELLLQERVPTRVILTKEFKEKVEPLKSLDVAYDEVVRVFDKVPDTPLPQVHILSNGSYSVMLTETGAGYSRCGNKAVSRWRDDNAYADYGTFFYIRNINSNNGWSATYAPYYDEPEYYKVIFSPDKAEYLRKDGNIETHTQIIVSPEDNVELRKISLTNRSNHVRVVEITSYFEVVLTEQSADLAHPAFSNLFVRTEFLPEYNCLVAHRRPREEGKETLWAIHLLAVEGEMTGPIQYETDRAKFIGRNRNLVDPAAMMVNAPLSNLVGSVLDPIMSLRCRVSIEPGKIVNIVYTTGVCGSREESVRLAEKYSSSGSAARAFELAWTRSRVEARYLGLKASEEEDFQKLLPHIIFTSPIRRQRKDFIAANTKGQPGLWAYGISGDNPIVLLSIGSIDETDIVRQLLKAHEYWRMKGLTIDLVIIHEDEGSYTQPLKDMIRDIISVSHARELQDKPGGVFLRAGKTMPQEDRNLFFTVARIVLTGSGGKLSDQIQQNDKKEAQDGIKIWSDQQHLYSSGLKSMEGLLYDNGWGGFNPASREYIIQLEKDERTPAPWINVISNHRFGFLATESGGGYVWSENSRENKLTPWSNDPVSDRPGEVLYIRDEVTGEIWTVTSLPIREEEMYRIRHGFGYTVYEHSSHGIHQELTVFVPKQETVKISILRLKNESGVKRELSATYYIRPVMGVSENNTAPYIVTGVHEDMGILLAENKFNSDYPRRVLFVDSSEEQRTYTGNRREFMGYINSLETPEGLKKYHELSNNIGAGYDPCAAIQVKFSMDSGEEKKLVFLLGQSEDLAEVTTICKKYRNINEAERALNEVKNFWEDTLGVIKVKTPDTSMDLLLNGWLLYQTICCRIWARSAFYQSGGAYGFRDQLQDAMSVVYVLPQLTYSQILRHAAHQFIEGDVQHWWHSAAEKENGGDKGIRTKFSDDLVWLPFVTADYIEKSQDWSILDVEIGYLEDELLGENEDERYNIPRVSQEKSSVYEHCIRALEWVLKFGEHGIPLMGSGDWNDGMSTVGNKGRGESVWLGWFLYTTLVRFIPICEARGDLERAQQYKKLAEEMVSNIEKNAWDGSWYRRAYFDDGTPLGSAQNSECKIDAIAQAWAVISGAAKESRAKEAMKALEHYLIKRDEGLIMLLTPPFDKGDLKPGYIKGYVPGVRENGGQYTHAAVWVILAFAMMGDGDKAWELYNMINPINHARTRIEAARYKVEPYVMAADVYAVHPHTGRGGWTWYTGTAGWMYRVGIEYILGLKKQGDKLTIEPCIPKKWAEYTIEYRYMETKYTITVKNPNGINRGVKSVILDNTIVPSKIIQLYDDKVEHTVEVIMGEE